MEPVSPQSKGWGLMEKQKATGTKRWQLSHIPSFLQEHQIAQNVFWFTQDLKWKAKQGQQNLPDLFLFDPG